MHTIFVFFISFLYVLFSAKLYDMSSIPVNVFSAPHIRRAVQTQQLEELKKAAIEKKNLNPSLNAQTNQPQIRPLLVDRFPNPSRLRAKTEILDESGFREAIQIIHPDRRLLADCIQLQFSDSSSLETVDELREREVSNQFEFHFVSMRLMLKEWLKKCNSKISGFSEFQAWKFSISTLFCMRN